MSKADKLAYGLMFIAVPLAYLVAGPWGFWIALMCAALGSGFLYSFHSRGLEDIAESEILALPRPARQTAESHTHLLPQIAQDVGEIKQSVAPRQRHLSTEQRSRLISLLRNGKAFETAVRHSQGNMESQLYADEFVAVLKEAGWKMNPQPRFLVQQRDAKGLWIMVHDMAKAPPCALLLQQSLKAVGLDAPGIAVPDLSPNPEATCELFVGLA